MASLVAAHPMAVEVVVAASMPSVAHFMLTRVMMTASVTLVISSAAISFVEMAVSVVPAWMHALAGKLCLLRSLSALELVVILPVVLPPVTVMIVMASLLILLVGAAVVFVNVMVVVT